MLIEKAGPGLQLVQDLRNDPTHGFPRPIGIVPEGDKWMRMEAQTPRFEAGHVLLPEEAPWLATFLDELLAVSSGNPFEDSWSIANGLELCAAKRTWKWQAPSAQPQPYNPATIEAARAGWRSNSVAAGSGGRCHSGRQHACPVLAASAGR